MIRPFRAKRSSQHGVAMIETALTLPLVLLILFGIVNFGFALYNKAIITNATREAARAGIVFSSSSWDNTRKAAVEQHVRNLCTNRVISFSANAQCAPVANRVGNTLQVRVTYPFGTIAGGLMPGMGSSMSLSAETQMQFEPI